MQPDPRDLYVVDELPPFVDPADLRAAAAEVLLPPKRMRISEAAERYRRLNTPTYVGGWKNAAAPYMVEPMDEGTSRLYEGVVFAGPARSLKTDSLVLNGLLHRILCHPLDSMLVHISQMEARDFSRTRIDKLIRDCPDVAARLSHSRHDNNVYDKSFQGMTLRIGWPSINVLSGKDIPIIWITDYDRIPDDIDGEGDAWTQGKKRSQTFGSLGKCIAESSPGRPVLKADWSPLTPHEAPPTTGILALYNRGDRRRWYWPCPQCGEYFEGSFRLLDWPKGLPIAAAAAQVTMICPACGYPIPPAAKREMNAAGCWAKDGQRVTAGGVVHGVGATSNIASFWLKGTAAAFQDWPSLVRNYLQAQQDLDRTGEETSLKSTLGLDQAEPYLPAALARKAKGALSAEALLDQAEDYPLGRVPAAARFLIASVDTQGNRWDYLVQAFGPHLESWVIDHGQIWKTGEGEDERPVSPARHGQDWDLLRSDLMARRYPLADRPDLSMAITLTVIDCQGEAGVTEKAYDFYRRCKTLHLHRRMLLLRGDGSAKAPRLVVTYPDSQRKDRHAGARGEVPVGIFNANSVKDDVDAALRREDAGPRRIHLPLALRAPQPPHEFFEQVAAEVRGDNGKWTKRRDRNEAWDLLVMGRVAALRLKADRILDWERPVKAWALPAERNPLVANAVRLDPDPERPPPPASTRPRPPPPAPPRPAPQAQRRSNWFRR